MAEMASAINDAPTDDLDIEDEVFSADRMRAYETGQLRHVASRMFRAFARHRETGELAGHTVVLVDGERPHLAQQHDTSVVRSHRGHRLGMLLKTDMLLWLREVQPQVAEIRHLERRVERPHDRRQRAHRLPGHGPGAGVPEVAVTARR